MSTATSPTQGNVPSIFKWAQTDGEFRRQTSSFRNYVTTDPKAQFIAEANRYHLYVSLACPWAHRTLIVRALKGLEDVISVTCVHYFLEEGGWRFADESVPGCSPDPEGNAYIKDLYFQADANYQGRYTVPVLWDKKTKTIVNNESAEIIRMLNTSFDEWAKTPDVTFYPDVHRESIDSINDWVYDLINNGVYKSGFATKQEVYEKHVRGVFEGLDRVESILGNTEFLCGSVVTEADIRLFTTVVRFDPVYHGHFKCNLKSITCHYPNLLRWARRMYQLPGVAETVNMEHIKKHYYMSHVQINPTRVVPISNGPDLTLEPIMKPPSPTKRKGSDDRQRVEK